MAASMTGQLFATLVALISAFFLTFSLASAATVPPKWALSYEGQSTNRFIWDPRTKGLVKHGVPARLASQILEALGGPPDPVFVTAQRYVSVSACVPHDCPEKGFFWIDTTTGSALGAYYESGPWIGEQPDGHFFGPGKLTLGSNAFSAENIPTPARQALINWLTDETINPEAVTFFDAAGRSKDLPIEEFQPRPVFQPLPNGPSFDCEAALTSIEKTICDDSQLQKLDLDLANQLKQMMHGYDTVGARNQLAALQREWLRKRDANCTGAADVTGCLKSSYEHQHHVLWNWIPK
jgi:hypothetical protein